jgi:hypothetical protein
LPPDWVVKLSKSGHYPLDNALSDRLSGWKKAVNEKEFAAANLGHHPVNEYNGDVAPTILWAGRLTYQSLDSFGAVHGSECPKRTHFKQ